MSVNNNLEIRMSTISNPNIQILEDFNPGNTGPQGGPTNANSNNKNIPLSLHNNQQQQPLSTAGVGSGNLNNSVVWNN